jgi:hypothetical protein
MQSSLTLERERFGGAILIGLGSFLLLVQLFRPTGALILGALAVLFLALYAGTRSYGFVVPGMILGGLAVGLALEQTGNSLGGGAVVLGLASGFLGIHVVNVFTGAALHWWPVIPGGILAMVGGAQAVGGTNAAAVVATWWPVILIVIGVIALFVRAPIRPTPTAASDPRVKT